MNLAIMIPATLIEVLILYYYWFSMFEMRYEKKKTIILFVGLSMLNVIKCWCMIEQVELKSVTTIIFNFVLIQILFKDKVNKKIIVYVVYLLCVIMAEFMSMFFAKYIYNCTSFSTTEASFPIVMWQATAYLLNYMFNAVALIIMRHKKIRKNGDVFHYIGLYAALQYLILFVFIMLAVNYIDSFMTVILLVLFLILISSVTAVWIYKTMREAMSKTMEAEFIKKEAEIKDKHFSELKEQYAEYKKLRHDFKNHLRILKEIEEPEKIREYTNLIQEKIEDMKSSSFCDNLTLDALLSLKRAEAIQKQIKISYEICDISGIKISDFDLCSVVANLLDNAIEAADKTEEKYIFMQITKKAERVVITVKNSSIFVDSTLKTTKADKKNHGIGVKSIKDVAEKNGGEYVYKYENSEFFSVVTMEC